MPPPLPTLSPLPETMELNSIPIDNQEKQQQQQHSITTTTTTTTRIPKPTQQIFRRSYSLRLRKTNYGQFSPDSPPPAPTTPPTISMSNRQCNCTINTTEFSAKHFNFLNLGDHELFKTDHLCNNIKESCHDGIPKKEFPTNNVDKLKSSPVKCEHKMTLNLSNGEPPTTSSTSFIKHPNSLHTPCCGKTSGKSPQTPKTPGANHIKPTPKTPQVTPESPQFAYEDDDDLDSLYSFSSVASGRSTMSSCEHPFVARNGTTFSGRRMKYVVHCSSYAGQIGDDYLTPTQRAQKHIKRLKILLSQARLDLEQKDSEILRLTKEVVELRLFKASLSSPEERSNSSDAVTVRENNDPKTSQDVSPIIDMTDSVVSGKMNSPRHILLHHQNLNQVQLMDKLTQNSSDMQSSFADSGNFEDLTTSSINSKDSYVQTHDIGIGSGGGGNCSSSNGNSTDYEHQKAELIKLYERRIEELISLQDTEKCDINRTHNDRVEALLQKLADCNSRYADLMPDYEQAKERIRELEKQLEDLQQKLHEQEEKQNKMYLHMYAKGQEAERITHADKVMEFARQTSNRISVPELMQQLQITQNELENIRDMNYRPEKGNSQVLLSAKEAISLWLVGARKTMYRRLIDAQQSKNRVDPEVTLQFLKSAIYYFLTDKENTQGHLNAIESILGFSELERLNIDKARISK